MVEACYMARATTKQQVLDSVNKLTLQTNSTANTLMMPSYYCTKAFIISA